MLFKKCRGSILALAAGDALGVPVETMTAEEICERYGRVDKLHPSPADHRFPEVRGKSAGTTSDDTQLTRALLQAIINSGGRFDMDEIARQHVVEFERSFGRGWGSSTRHSIERVRDGVQWSRSAQPNGGGNGVVMKIPPLGLMHALNGEIFNRKLLEQAIELGQMTHGDPTAVAAGVAHAVAVAYLSRINLQVPTEATRFPKQLRGLRSAVGFSILSAELMLGLPRRTELWDVWERVGSLLEDQNTHSLVEIGEREFCLKTKSAFRATNSFGLSYLAFMRDPCSFESVIDVINAGGDTDTNGAIVGSLVGALNGPDIIPAHILNGIEDREEIEKQVAEFVKTVRSPT